MARTSVKAAARGAVQEDKRARAALTKDGQRQLGAVSHDSFVNFAHKLGIGADNPTSFSTYGFNPITRNRILLEWIHRGSWLGGLAVDIVASDMTRRGVEFKTEIDPQDSDSIERAITAYNVWGSINETIQWGRLYGGSIAVALIDGQDPREPLRLNTVGPGAYKGMLVLDRWMVEPSLEDLVTDLGPNLGQPKYYRVTASAPALRGAVIHYSRVMVRHVGIKLPYQQALQEQLWGISVLERLYDRMVAFDSATTGAAQLVYKSFLRTLSVEGLRDVVSAGGKPLAGLTSYVDMMRRFQGIEGMTLIDSKDKYEQQSHSSFSGLSDVLVQFGQQLSGGLQIPLVRLFGQSPSGLNSSGESDLRTYYDGIRQKQQTDIFHGISLTYMLVARSKGIVLPDNFAVDFRSLRELDDSEKTTIAKDSTAVVMEAHDGGLIGRQTALKELRQASRITGVFTNITREMIEAADDTVAPPSPEGVTMPDGSVLPGPPNPQAQGLNDDQAGPQGAPAQMGQGGQRRVPLQQPLD